MKKNRINFPFLFLFVGILISCISYIIPSIESKTSTNYFNLEPDGEILKDTRIYQDIYVPKNIKKYKLMFGTFARNNTGKIKVKIVQGSIKKEELIDVSKLKDNEVNDIHLDYSKFKNGKARLIIEGIDGIPGNAVTIYKSSDISLGKMFVNNQNTEKGIIQQIEYTKIDKTVKVQVTLTICLMIILIYFYKLLKNKKKENTKIYVITVTIMYLLISIKFPVMTIFTEPFAEFGTNFFLNASTKNIFDNLLLQDAGYLPLYQRIFSLIIVKIFVISPKIAVILMQNSLILIMSSIISIFMLKEYNKYGNIFFRFVVCLILAGFPILHVYETHSFINIGYFNLVGIILISLLNFENFTKKKFMLIMVVTFFLCLSKAYFIVLFPIVVVIYMIFRKKVSKREKIYLFVIALSTLIQAIYTYNNSKWIDTINEKKITLIENISRIFHNIVQQVIYLFFSNISLDSNIFSLNLIFLVIIIISIISALYYFYKYKNKESVILISLILIIFGTSILNIKARIWDSEIFWTKTTGIMKVRHSFFIQISIIFFVIIFIFNYLKDQKRVLLKNNLYTILGLMFFIRFLVFDNNYIYIKDNSFSDWNIYSKFYKEKEYLIPLNPEFWYINKNIEVHYIGYKEDNVLKFENDKRTKFLDYSLQQIHEINFDTPIYLTHLYLTRLRIDNFDKLKIRGYDNNGNIVVELDQLNNKNRRYIGFRNYKKVAISKIKIFNEDLQEAYVIPKIMYGESLSN